MDENKFIGVGRLTKDPEYHPAGRKGEAHATFTLAMNRVVSNERGPQADYVPCSIWGDVAKEFCEQRSKGDEVGIIGRIRTNMVPQASGKPLFLWEVRVDRIHLGCRALKNLRPQPIQNAETSALAQLSSEFIPKGE